MTQTNQQPAAAPWGKPFRMAGTILLLLPPLVIMLSVMVGVHEFGLLGGIIAVPVIASAREIVKYVKERLAQSHPDPMQAEEASN